MVRRGQFGPSPLGRIFVVALLLASLLGLVGLPRANASDPNGYASCDYDNWQVDNVLEGMIGGDWSVDGTQLLTTHIVDYDATIVEVATGDVVEKISFEGQIFNPTWSADGRTIVFDSPHDNPPGPAGSSLIPAEGEGNDLWAYDRETHTFSRLTGGDDEWNSDARFSHAGSRLAWIRHDVAGRATRYVPTVGTLVRDADGTPHLADVEPALADPDHPAYGAFNRTGDFTADGEGLVLISTQANTGNGDVWHLDLDNGEWTNLTAASQYWEEFPRAAPNGQVISFTSTRDYPEVVNVALEVSSAGWAAWRGSGDEATPGAFDELSQMGEQTGGEGGPSGTDAAFLPYAYALSASPVLAYSQESYLANADGSNPHSLTLGNEYGIEGGWFSLAGTFSRDGTRLALSQTSVEQVRVPGAPPNTVQVSGPAAQVVQRVALQDVAPRRQRILVASFECA